MTSRTYCQVTLAGRGDHPLDEGADPWDEHEKLPCHGAALYDEHGEVVWVCADARLHASDDEPASTAEDLAARDQAKADQEAAEKAAERAIKRSHKDRLVFMGALGPASPTRTPTGSPMLSPSAVGREDTARLAGQMLGLAPSSR
jgi:hypothetical protein